MLRRNLFKEKNNCINILEVPDLSEIIISHFVNTLTVNKLKVLYSENHRLFDYYLEILIFIIKKQRWTECILGYKGPVAGTRIEITGQVITFKNILRNLFYGDIILAQPVIYNKIINKDNINEQELADGEYIYRSCSFDPDQLYSTAVNRKHSRILKRKHIEYIE